MTEEEKIRHDLIYIRNLIDGKLFSEHQPSLILKELISKLIEFGLINEKREYL